MQQLGYRPALDGLRGLACLAVVVGHTWPQPFAPAATVGVQLFFALSGFLITTLLLEEQRRTGRVCLGSFYLRRAARLVPGLVVMCAAVIAVAPLYMPAVAHDTRVGVLSAATYSSNWLRAAGVGTGAMAHCWSLAVEEQFYLVWPVVLVSALRRRPRAAIWWLVGVWVCAVAVRSALFAARPTESMLTFLVDAFPLNADALIAGCLAGLLRHEGWLRSADRSGSGRYRSWLTAGSVVLVGYVVLGHPDTDLVGGGYLLLAAASVAVLVGAVEQPWRLLRARPLVSLGEVSYGLYLWQSPVFMLLSTYGVPRGPLLLVWTLSSTCGFAYGSHRLVETPVRRWARRRRSGSLAYGPVRVAATANSPML